MDVAEARSRPWGMAGHVAGTRQGSELGKCAGRLVGGRRGALRGHFWSHVSRCERTRPPPSAESVPARAGGLPGRRGPTDLRGQIGETCLERIRIPSHPPPRSAPDLRKRRSGQQLAGQPAHLHLRLGRLGVPGAASTRSEEQVHTQTDQKHDEQPPEPGGQPAIGGVGGGRGRRGSGRRRGGLGHRHGRQGASRRRQLPPPPAQPLSSSTARVLTGRTDARTRAAAGV